MIMLACTKSNTLLILLIFSNFSFAQIKPITKAKDSTKYIHIMYADHAATNEKYPRKQLLSGNVQIEHNGGLLYCDKALVDKQENTAVAIGNVRLEQGDTIHMQAGYIKYNGNTSFAEAFQHVILTDPKMSLQTDTLYYNRNIQEAYYTSGGKIRDSISTLNSKIGRYLLNENKFVFINNVHVENPDYKIDSYQLNYFTDSGISNFYGPTKIYNQKSYIYAEKGHYDAKQKISWFVKNAFIKHKNTSLKADSLYYDQNIEYATGTHNVVVYDSIQHSWIYSNYAQRWTNKDSVRVSGQPLVISIKEKDTLYMRAQQFITAGKKGGQKLWAFKKVKFFSNDFSGRTDSLYRDETQHIMKLETTPVIWSGDSQITGNKILIKNDSLQNLDSLIIPKKVFIIQRDSSGGFNQIKGKKLLGKFIEQNLKTIDLYGNTEVIYYLHEDSGELMGIEKNKSSHIFIEFKQNTISTIRFYEKPDGTIYPPEKLLEKDKKFKNFKWLGDQIINKKEDVIDDAKITFSAVTLQKSTSKEKENN